MLKGLDLEQEVEQISIKIIAYNSAEPMKTLFFFMKIEPLEI